MFLCSSQTAILPWFSGDVSAMYPHLEDSLLLISCYMMVKRLLAEEAHRA